MANKKDLVGYVDPGSIDLDLACRMSGAWDSHFADDKPYTYKSDFYRAVIDFDELAKIKPPKGYGIEVYRDITIWTSSFRGMCPGAVHYYCNIRFYGPSLTRNGCSVSGYLGGLKVGRIFTSKELNVNRPVTKEDLSDKYADWDGYQVGDMTHRWYSTKNAIECAKRIVELRFRNYGEITVEDCEEK